MLRARVACLAGAAAALLTAAARVTATDDPFADVAPRTPSNATPARLAAPAWRDNLQARRELYLLSAAGRDDFDTSHDIMARLSAGFELQKRFATAFRTVGAFDYQGRFVYRSHALATAADPMGRDASRREYETHNAYLDLYNLAGAPGRLNLRVGHFYQPFGLNQQTDTHGTLLQLANERLFGADRDWQATLYGTLGDALDYTAGYLLGAGPDWKLEGQSGLGAARLALNNRWLFERGLEGGVSFAAGERVDEHAHMRLGAGRAGAGGEPLVSGWRTGVDLRQRLDTGAGPCALTAEVAAGQDEHDPLLSLLAQADWLHPRRRWGAALQYRRFRQETGAGTEDFVEEGASGVLTYYLRNDVGNANLHWIALAWEHAIRQTDGTEDAIMMVQYYRYW